MKRTRFALATVGAALIGSVIFTALLPWGDPCAFTVPVGEAGCEVSTPDNTHLRNAVFIVICVLIGLVGALLARTRPHLAGAGSVIAAAVFTHFGARWFHGLESVPLNLLGSTTAFQTLIYVGLLAALGATGGFLSRYVRLTTRWSGP